MVSQSDHYAEAAATPRRDSGLTFSASSEVFATRADWSQWGAVRFDDKLVRFVLSGRGGYEISTRAEEVSGPLARLRLAADGTPLHQRQRAFQAPSNLMYLPGEYASINCCPICATGPDHPPCEPCYEDPPPPPPPPTVIIDSFSPNPIVLGSTANVHITVTPSAPITLTIITLGTGRATFGSTGNTTVQISETTTVNIRGDALSTSGAADLTLAASYSGTYLATAAFSVTTGACTAGYTGFAGDGLKNCPSQVQLRDTYNITNYCSACQFSCEAINFDSTFTPGLCSSITAGFSGAGNQGLTSTLTGNFTATDCNWHTVKIRTTIVNAQGTATLHTGSAIGLKCTTSPSGSACP